MEKQKEITKTKIKYNALKSKNRKNYFNWMNQKSSNKEKKLL